MPSMKFKELDSSQIITIRNVLANTYDIPSGHVEQGRIDALLQKIDFLNSDNIIQRAAILFEGLTRLHLFSDGNKRTALESVKQYLHLNGLCIVFPLGTVAFSYKVASTVTVDPKNNERLIDEISDWLESFTVPASQNMRYKAMFLIHYTVPVTSIRFCKRLNLYRLGRMILRSCLQYNLKDLDTKMINHVSGSLEKQMGLTGKKYAIKS